LQVVVVERQLLEILVREFAAIRELMPVLLEPMEPSQGQSNFHRCFGELNGACVKLVRRRV
jgi:hypothetical protein